MVGCARRPQARQHEWAKLQAGFSPNEIAQYSGHKNIASINEYAVSSVPQRKKMQQVMCRVSATQPNVIPEETEDELFALKPHKRAASLPDVYSQRTPQKVKKLTTTPARSAKSSCTVTRLAPAPPKVNSLHSQCRAPRDSCCNKQYNCYCRYFLATDSSGPQGGHASQTSSTSAFGRWYARSSH